MHTMRRPLLTIAALLATSCSALPSSGSSADLRIEAEAPTSTTTNDPAPTTTTTVEEGTAAPTSEPTNTSPTTPEPAMLITLVEDIDPGFLGSDGVIVAEYPADAMRWHMTLAFDPASGFAYSAVDAVAEPGDAGCWEMLVPRFDGRPRSTTDRADNFEPTGQAAHPSRSVEVSRSFGPHPRRPRGNRRQPRCQQRLMTSTRTADDRAGPEQLQQLVGHVAGIGGQIPALDDGTLSFDIDTDGRLERYEVQAEGLDDQIRERDRRHRLYRLTVTLEPLPETFKGITSTTPRRQAGGCLDRSAAIVGSWRLASGHCRARRTPSRHSLRSPTPPPSCVDRRNRRDHRHHRLPEPHAQPGGKSPGSPMSNQIEGEACTDEMARMRDENLLAVLQSDPGILVYADGVALVGSDGIVTLVPGD
ncbi:MAG: hypothetical protein R2710_11085 [Acidimicrobiales bacterium]